MGMEIVQSDPLPWLLETDPANPAVRYFALRDLLDRSEDEPEVRRAGADIMATGRVPEILAAQKPEGYWFQPGAGYSPRYRGTAWQIIFLSDLGADPADERVQRGCEYLLEHSPATNGAFSTCDPPTPDGAMHCLNGNLLYALFTLGYTGDLRVQAAMNWQVHAITGEGEISYYRGGTTGPGFACSMNQGQPCGWGAVKALKALSAIPPDQRSQPVQRAIATGAEFLLSRDPSKAGYPYKGRVSPRWFIFGFPLSYWSDVLENTAVLVDLGYGDDPRLANALRYIMNKQDAQGRWKLENTLNSKVWPDIEIRGKPSKWITLRSLRLLKRSAQR
jgi:hypothetical protein